ncbi:MAG: aminoacyl-tRNA hydrolase [Candidatus Obscuribacterales bacterium]|nr:aminoacyl-tRNA hydrolase [Candidatus Obscuribacterales bacterium]
MKLVVGLGNPGSEYENTRHNAGFRVIDYLSTELGASFSKKTSLFGADYEYARVAYPKKDDELILLKPLTFMNRSGQAVKAVLDWFKISPQDMVVVHDDVFLPLGRIRVQKGGGAGGNHGIESIFEHLKNDRQFSRVKVGVGPDPGGDVRHKYVLNPVPEADQKLYEEVLLLCKQAATCVLSRGPDFAANKFNGKNLAEPEVKPARPERKPEPRVKSELELQAELQAESNAGPDSRADAASESDCKFES